LRIVTIVGARPQFIKAAPFSRAIRRQHQEYLIHTGQHFDADMSDVFFDELGIPKPDANLGIGALTNVEQVGHMLLALRPILAEYQPDWVVVYGDTNSTLAGALVARMLGLPIAHIEAGLRSYNQIMPEEMNRVLTDHISSALFCPTNAAAENLAKEGITAGVHVVGDIMIDALQQNRERIRPAVLAEYGVRPQQYLLATIHRASNTDAPATLRAIFAALAALPDRPIVIPAHPRLRKALAQHAITVSPNVKLVPPLGYLDMLSLSASAEIILTDSGGLQKEAYALGVPCVTLREETEWVETVDTGWNQLAGASQDRILAAVTAAHRPALHPAIYGDGRASDNIVAILVERFSERATIKPSSAAPFATKD
jgi:UDP-GlcNAc3NAcA epimerase